MSWGLVQRGPCVQSLEVKDPLVPGGSCTAKANALHSSATGLPTCTQLQCCRRCPPAASYQVQAARQPQPHFQSPHATHPGPTCRMDRLAESGEMIRMVSPKYCVSQMDSSCRPRTITSATLSLGVPSTPAGTERVWGVAKALTSASCATMTPRFRRACPLGGEPEPPPCSWLVRVLWHGHLAAATTMVHANIHRGGGKKQCRHHCTLTTHLGVAASRVRAHHPAPGLPPQSLAGPGQRRPPPLHPESCTLARSCRGPGRVQLRPALLSVTAAIPHIMMLEVVHAARPGSLPGWPARKLLCGGLAASAPARSSMRSRDLLI